MQIKEVVLVKEQILHIASCILIGYSLGCISPSYIMGKINGIDVRKSGSKNAGASNVLLLVGKLTGVLVALLDIFKAAASWWICAAVFPEIELAGLIGGVACIMGHLSPLVLGFHGGKGLACLGGVILAYSPNSFLLMLCFALVIGLVTNYVCIVTVSMSLIFPAYYYFITGSLVGAAILAVPSVPITIKHFENFRRIKEGKEFRLSFLWDKQGELLRTGHEDDDI